MAKINWCDVPSWLVHALNSKINILLPILLTLAHKSNCSNDGKSSLCPVCGKPFLFLEGSLKVYKWWWAQRPTFIFFGFCDKMKAQHQCFIMHGFEDNFGLCVFNYVVIAMNCITLHHLWFSILIPAIQLELQPKIWDNSLCFLFTL